MQKATRIGLTIAMVVCVLALALVGCSSTPTPTPTPTAKPAPAPAPAPTTSAAPKPAPTATSTIRSKEFTFAFIYAATTDYYTQLNKPFADKVSELSGGKMKVKIFPDATLGKSNMQSDTIGTGRADMGILVTQYEAGKFPLLEGVLAFPDFWNEYKYFGPNIGALIEQFPELQSELQKYNIRYIGYSQVTSGYHMFTRAQMKTLADAKGKLIAIAGGTFSQFAEALGLTPVAMATAELYLALQKGTVDGSISSASVAAGSSLYEVAKYGLNMGIFFTGAPYVINADVWKGLNKDEQAVLTEASKFGWQTYLKWMYTSDEVNNKKLADAGLTWTSMTDTERAAARVKIAAVAQKWATEKGAIAQKMLAYSKDLLAKPPAY